MAGQILIVEDDPEIREMLALLLLRDGHQVQQASSAEDAARLLSAKQFDLMIVDWMLPGVSGAELIKQARKQVGIGKVAQMPVLMVTAKSEPEDVIAGLEAGADDFMTKPFEPTILMARVKALLRRAQVATPVDSNKVLKVGQLKMDMDTYEVQIGSEPLHLTPSEFKILSTMISHQGKVLTRDRLIEIVQGEGISVTGRTIDTHVFGMRKKLGPVADYIETVRGVGYRIKTDL